MAWHDSVVAYRLGVRYPIVQGPFGGGLSSAALVAAVSNAGGLGSYGAHGLTPDALRHVVDDIRTRTTQPFAVNLWVSTEDPEAVNVNADAVAPQPCFEAALDLSRDLRFQRRVAEVRWREARAKLTTQWREGRELVERARLSASSETSFFMSEGSGEIEFVKDDTGKVASFLFYQGGAPRSASRK